LITVSHTVTGRVAFTKLGEMTGADTGTNLLHFGSDTVDILIQTNPEIRLVFSWGNQSSRDQVHVALAEVCVIWVFF